jgi:hypothetical protein
VVAVQVGDEDDVHVVGADACCFQVAGGLALDAAHLLVRALAEAGVHEDGAPAGAEGEEAYLDEDFAVLSEVLFVGGPGLRGDVWEHLGGIAGVGADVGEGDDLDVADACAVRAHEGASFMRCGVCVCVGREVVGWGPSPWSYEGIMGDGRVDGEPHLGELGRFCGG